MMLLMLGGVGACFASASPVLAATSASPGSEIVVHPSAIAALDASLSSKGSDAIGTADPRWRLAYAEPDAQPAYGPAQPENAAEPAKARRYTSFGSQFHLVRWEVLGFAAYVTALHVDELFKQGTSFHFQNEGWFGKDTENLGVDKLAHVYNGYLAAEVFQRQIHHKSGGETNGALTSLILSMAVMTYGEVYDGLKKDSGFSPQDTIANFTGAAFSVLRHNVPGLREKLDFRMMVIPNSDIYSPTGKRHYAQMRFLLALQLAGFKGLENSPLRFVELQAGYYAKNITNPERARGEIPQRKPFVGIGLNLQELFFKRPRSGIARAANTVLDYIQIPYTEAHID